MNTEKELYSKVEIAKILNKRYYDIERAVAEGRMEMVIVEGKKMYKMPDVWVKPVRKKYTRKEVVLPKFGQVQTH